MSQSALPFRVYPGVGSVRSGCGRGAGVAGLFYLSAGSGPKCAPSRHHYGIRAGARGAGAVLLSGGHGAQIVVIGSDSTQPGLPEQNRSGCFLQVLTEGGLTSLDFQFKLQGNYDQAREYICQYSETHFDFFARRLERMGMYFFFRGYERG
jgi:hypothetical protein